MSCAAYSVDTRKKSIYRYLLIVSVFVIGEAQASHLCRFLLQISEFAVVLPKVGRGFVRTSAPLLKDDSCGAFAFGATLLMYSM